jgi:flagellar protein FlaF
MFMSYGSYAKAQQVTLNASPEQTEIHALSAGAKRLADAQADGSAAAILEAVRWNWKVWTLFQVALIDPDNPAPREIRENLLSLARFIDKQSIDIIASPQAEKLDSLININRQVAAGLSEGHQKSQAAPSSSAQAKPTDART